MHWIWCYLLKIIRMVMVYGVCLFVKTPPHTQTLFKNKKLKRGENETFFFFTTYDCMIANYLLLSQLTIHIVYLHAFSKQKLKFIFVSYPFFKFDFKWISMCILLLLALFSCILTRSSVFRSICRMYAYVCNVQVDVAFFVIIYYLLFAIIIFYSLFGFCLVILYFFHCLHDLDIH